MFEEAVVITGDGAGAYVGAGANTRVAQYLARVDEVYVAVDTRGYPSLGTAIRAQQHPAA